MSISEKRAVIILAMLLTAVSLPAYALNRAGQLLHHWETAVNPVLHPEDQHKYPQIIKLPHVEIPLSFVQANLSAQMDESILKSLVFSKEGVPTIRWILAPGAKDIAVGSMTEIFNNELLDFLKSKKMDTSIHYEFTGYPTASTTYLIEDPNNKTVFFVKTSNSMAPAGTYKVKKREPWESNDARIVNDYLTGLNREVPFKHFGFFPESAGFVLNGIGMALIIREAGDINEKENSRKIYLPAFSALDPVLGAEIAKKNGFANANEFWSKMFPQLLASAVTELFVRTGLKFDSTHSQNYLFEMDAEMRLTGRIIFRDLADMMILKSFYDIYHEKYKLNRLMQEKRILDPSRNANRVGFYLTPFESTRVPLTPLLVNHPWLPNQAQLLSQWGPLFQARSAEVFRSMTGITIANEMSEDKISFADYPQHKRDGFGFDLMMSSTAESWIAFMNRVLQGSAAVRACHLVHL